MQNQHQKKAQENEHLLSFIPVPLLKQTNSHPSIHPLQYFLSVTYINNSLSSQIIPATPTSTSVSHQEFASANHLLLQFVMGVFVTIARHFAKFAGPGVTLIYPLYASIRAIESPSELDDQQWLTYWVLYSLITLFELSFYKVLAWIPIWPYLKLILTFWLVLPMFNGAAYIYENYVRNFIVSKYQPGQELPKVGKYQSRQELPDQELPKAGKYQSRQELLDQELPKAGKYQSRQELPDQELPRAGKYQLGQELPRAGKYQPGKELPKGKKQVLKMISPAVSAGIERYIPIQGDDSLERVVNEVSYIPIQEDASLESVIN